MADEGKTHLNKLRRRAKQRGFSLWLKRGARNKHLKQAGRPGEYELYKWLDARTAYVVLPAATLDDIAAYLDSNSDDSLTKLHHNPHHYSATLH
jgi:hypothetical protein